MKKLSLFTLLLFIIQVNVFGQSDWKLSTEKDGIKIYMLKMPDSKFKAVKVECEIDATPAQLVALIMDVNTSAEWMYHTKSAMLIKQVSPSEIYYYSEVNLPWPAANRDFVAHLIVSQNQATKVVTIDGPAINGMVPVKGGIVRITNSTSKWTITPDDIDKVKIEYTLHADPGGSIPAWMANMFATQGPLEIFKKLKVQIQKPAYKNADLSYIDSKSYALNTKP